MTEVIKKNSRFCKLDTYDFDIIKNEQPNSQWIIQIDHLQEIDIPIIAEDIYRHDDHLYLESKKYMAVDYQSYRKDGYITMEILANDYRRRVRA